MSASLTIETTWAPARFTMPFIVLSGGGDAVIIGQKTLREKLGIDVMAQLKASVLKAQGRQDGAWMELTARSMDEPNGGAALQSAMAVTAFRPGGDAPGNVNDEVTLTLPSQRTMIFQDSEVEMRGRVGVLETAVNNAVDHGSPSECAKMLCDIVFRTHLDVLRRVLPGDPHARTKPVAVRLHAGARVVRAKPPPERNRLPWSAAESCCDCRSVVTTSSSSRWPGKGRRRRGAPGSRCRACLLARRPCCEKGSRCCSWRRSRSGRSYSGMDYVCDHTAVLGGVPDSELLVFGFIWMLISSFSELEFLRRELIASDAATAAGSLPTLCVDRACPGLMLLFTSGYCTEIHMPCVVWVSASCMRNWRSDAWRVVCLKMHW